MNLSRESLMRDAMATGFRPEMLEKVVHLLSLLKAIRSSGIAWHSRAGRR